ncbi:MAG: hypothetical protein QM528_02055 [Phycisphaerales bacterium]|nr:hypothetical protein [Phycisphaerales bacterium]
MNQLLNKNWIRVVLSTIILCAILINFMCCNNNNFVPKPRGYFKIDFPKKEYQTFHVSGYPYEFEYPVYAQITKDSTFFDHPTENPWWINIDFPQLNGRIYVSYKKIDKKHPLGKILKDVFTMTNKQSVKAYSIEDSIFENPYHIDGIFFKVGGDVATAYQFFLTDSTKNFFRGALYFNTLPNEDSLGIVYNFLLTDLKHLVNTFKWATVN